MAKHVCPWWIGFLLVSPLRRWLWGEDSSKILAPYALEGKTVFEPGPGMGFLTLELAHRVGLSGKVIAVDVQAKMLAGLKRRAAKAGLLERIELRLASPDSMGVSDLAGKIDFTLAYALVHEMPSAANFFRETALVSKPGALLLLAEPAGHVKLDEFQAELKYAADAGFIVIERPAVARSNAALLRKA